MLVIVYYASIKLIVLILLSSYLTETYNVCCAMDSTSPCIRDIRKVFVVPWIPMSPCIRDIRIMFVVPWTPTSPCKLRLSARESSN